MHTGPAPPATPAAQGGPSSFQRRPSRGGEGAPAPTPLLASASTHVGLWYPTCAIITMLAGWEEEGPERVFRHRMYRAGAVLCAAMLVLGLTSCAAPDAQGSSRGESVAAGSQAPAEQERGTQDTGASTADPSTKDSSAAEKAAAQKRKQTLKRLAAKLKLQKDFHRSLSHGSKPAKYQKYIVLHDTESDAAANDVLSYWLSNGTYVAAHFIVNKDGSVLQCVRMNAIAHQGGPQPPAPVLLGKGRDASAPLHTLRVSDSPKYEYVSFAKTN